MPNKSRNPLGGIGEAFSDRNFRIYSIGSVGSWASFFIQLVAVAWLAWELTHSTKWLAAVALLDLLPNILLMPLAGAIADRFDRHKIMLVTSALCGFQAIALAILAYLQILDIWLLAFLALVHGIIITFMVPAMYGIIPRFIAKERVASAIAVNASYTQLTSFVGPAFAGWLLLNYGTTFAFVINAAGYCLLISAFLLLKDREDFDQGIQTGRSIRGEILSGFSYIFSKRVIVFLILISLVADALSHGFLHMVPAFSDLVLGLGVIGVSVIYSLRGVGATAAAVMLAYLGEKVAKINWVFWAFLGSSLSLLGLVSVTNLYFVGFFAAMMGFTNEIRKTIGFTIIQLTVEENQRGRVTGSLFMVNQIAAGLAVYLIGSIAGDFGLRYPFAAGACFAIFFWLFLHLAYNKRKAG